MFLYHHCSTGEWSCHHQSLAKPGDSPTPHPRASWNSSSSTPAWLGWRHGLTWYRAGQRWSRYVILVVNCLGQHLKELQSDFVCLYYQVFFVLLIVGYIKEDTLSTNNTSSIWTRIAATLSGTYMNGASQPAAIDRVKRSCRFRFFVFPRPSVKWYPWKFPRWISSCLVWDVDRFTATI